MIEEILQEAKTVADQRNHEVIMAVMSEKFGGKVLDEYSCLEEKMRELLEQIDHQNWIIFNLPYSASESQWAWKERQWYMDELKIIQLKMQKLSPHQFFS